MKKQIAKNIIKQKSQQVNLNLTNKYYKYKSKITLLLFLDIINHKI